MWPADSSGVCVRANARCACLVAHHRAKLVLGGPVREDPDHLGPIGGVRALEAVAQPEFRRRDHRVDERDVGMRDAELPAGFSQRGQRGFDVLGGGVAIRT